MVNKDEMYHRLDEIRQSLDYLKNMEQDELKVRDKFLLARYNLQMILEAMFTIGNQIIANQSFRKPTSYRDILTVLRENEVFGDNLERALLPYADLRNRLVHTYWKISMEELVRIIKEELPYFAEFTQRVVAYVDKFK